MHIRKLELQGFKSFPDRTTFHFGPGISGVVGPNGCGKSNVVDAVKWCLGEMSAKSLRGSAMQDVIFAGSADRKPTGLAEVTLTFSAGDEPFPGELARHEEVQVSRRLFRDGHSEYLINQQRVRRRDISDLFLDSGVGNQMYSFIEQGRIGQLVNAKPEQRRALLEEAAGISRYKARRDEAEGRLRSTLQNLERVIDVTDDLSQRLKSLGGQVTKAMRHRRLRSRIRQAELFIGVAQFSGLIGDRRALGAQVREAEHVEAGLLAELEARRRETESARQYQDREQADLQGRVEGLELQRARATEQAAQSGARLSETEQERDQLEASLKAGSSNLDVRKAALREAEQAVRARHRTIDRHKNAVLEQIKRQSRLSAESESSKRRHAELSSERGRMRERAHEAEADLGGLSSALDQAKMAQKEAERLLAGHRQSLEAANAALRSMDQAKGIARAKTKAAEAQRDKSGRLLATVQARRESLEALQESHAGVDDAARAALALPGSLGTLAEQLDVPPELEQALAVALGPQLDAVLVRSVTDAQAALAAATGRIQVLVVTDPPALELGPFARIEGTALGRSALHMLVGGASSVPDLAAALADPHRPSLVQTDGEAVWLDARGLAHAGVPGTAGRAILARRRKIKALGAEEASAAATLNTHVAEAKRAHAALATASSAVESQAADRDGARSAVGEAELQCKDMVRQTNAAHVELQRAQQRAARVSADQSAVEHRLAQLASRAKIVEAELAETQRRQIAAEAALQEDQSALVGENQTLGQAREAVQASSTRASTLRERLAGVRRTHDEVQRAASGALREVERCQTELVASRARLDELASDDVRLRTELSQISNRQGELREKLDAERTAVQAERSRIAAQDGALSGLRERREAASAQRIELDRSLVRTKEQITQIREHLQERHQRNVPAMVDQLQRVGHLQLAADPSAKDQAIPELEQPTARDRELIEDLTIKPAMLDDGAVLARWVDELQRCRTALERLGEVNLVAVHEYKEVQERYQMLDTQREDLEGSVNTIRQTVAKLNRISRERFRETFDRVDQYFREIYPRLVGGGQARLELTDEEDLLQTGVDIFVQPPGKRLVNLTLLSGGETAMVAIALIFSLFRVKPSPFCLLDEVDAPLDEGNGARFNLMLREMATASQFIVITHNKKTMEGADTLYGVTMPTPGVSRLVSARLDG